MQVALVEVLAEAGDDAVLAAAEAHLETIVDWLGDAAEAPPPGNGAGAERLFRTLYPEVVGRRSPGQIIGRVRRKWELGHGLAGVLASVREPIRALAGLRGSAPDVLDRLKTFAQIVPEMSRELTNLVDGLKGQGIDPGRIELDLGFGRGIGFYSQMVFVLMAGNVEVCGGGRYDGLARALGSAVDVGGVGFAFGLERLRDVVDAGRSV